MTSADESRHPNPLQEAAHPEAFPAWNSDYPLTSSGRTLLMIWIVILLVIFGIAIALKPDPAGMGTHQQLGLPACSMVSFFGVPCPTCGMTTSFAHFIRGQFTASARANIAGLGLAATCFAMIPWGFASLSVGRLWRIKDPHAVIVWLVGLVTVISAVQWIFKVMPQFS